MKYILNQDLVYDSKVIPGIGDHEGCALITVEDKLKKNRKKPRVIYKFDKGDNTSLKDDIRKFSETFTKTDYKQQSVNSNWESLKSAIKTSMDKHIPTKRTTNKNKLPWIGNNIRRLIRKRKKLYDKAKKTKKNDDWKKFKSLRKHIKTKIHQAKNDYLLDILNTKCKERCKKGLELLQDQQERSSRNTTTKNRQGHGNNKQK